MMQKIKYNETNLLVKQWQLSKSYFFDPILEEHSRKFGNKGSGSTSYISKTIYEEFIQLLAQKVSAIIVQEIKSAKFYAIMVDKISPVKIYGKNSRSYP